MKSRDVRQSFLDFFVQEDHRLFASAPLVPRGDPTLLFTNAGMVPFKDNFLGVEEPPHKRATSSQKCLRVSGKHNDLENVGPSPRHHTFFEMLGNFSFGDYFKAEAIEFAWRLVTDVWGLEPDHLFASIYRRDDEAFELWRKITSLDADRIVRCGKADNFWAMGDVGPCGPCSEIHVDRHPDQPQVSWQEGSESGRYFEIWNLVFMQFESDESGALTPLPNPSIDTGAGLERVAALLQGVDSNYDTDLFQPLLRHTSELASIRYGTNEALDVSMRVVADHSRAVAFLLADGVIPSNEGRGYVLRRILRRAARHGMRLGLDEPFLHRLLPTLEEIMPVYPELAEARSASEATIKSEEEKFLATVAAAASQVQDAIEAGRQAGSTVLDGETVFRLYDTHGLPPEMVLEIAQEEGFSVDREGFESALDVQRQRSRSVASRVQEQSSSLRTALCLRDERPQVEFLGYDRHQLEDASVVRLAAASDDSFEAAEALEVGDEGVMVLDRTVFYGESGGQVGDRGTACGAAQVEILDTQRDRSGLILQHIRVLEGTLSVGDRLDLKVDAGRRTSTERNHTATHLLQASLRQQLGSSVRQAGSLVDPDRLRFDFIYDQPLDPEARRGIEEVVSDWVRRALPTVIAERSYDEAVESGAMALFGEKYGERVRTVEIPGFSLELCGGCHVRNTGEIGGFRIVAERGVASGVRRIEAVTGEAAEKLSRREHEAVGRIEAVLAVPIDDAADEIAGLRSTLKSTEKELAKLRLQLVSQQSAKPAEEVEVAGVKVVAREVSSLSFGELRNMVDVLKHKLGSGIVVLGTRNDDKVSLVVAVSDDLKERVGADRLAAQLGELVGGSGGGRADFGQAGGKDPGLLADALGAVAATVGELLDAAG